MYRTINKTKLKRTKIITFICVMVAIVMLSATPKQLNGKALHPAPQKTASHP